MSDFDTVLERLLSDPAFAAALAADPAGTLAGYRLEPDEMALLHTQVGGDLGGQSGVEVRANQSSFFGLLSPLTGLAGALPGLLDPGPTGSVDGAGGSDMGPGAERSTAGLGSREAAQGFGSREAAQGFGSRSDPTQGLGQAGVGVPGVAGLAEVVTTAGGSGSAGDALADVLHSPESGSGGTGFGSGGVESGFGGSPAPAELPPVAPAELVVPDGYRTRVDVDGDGVWDRYELRGRADGGVDILVDSDGDGRVDFVGHDLDADGLVDISEYDRDGDGFFEQRMYDDDGDGWMDRSVRVDRPGNPVD